MTQKEWLNSLDVGLVTYDTYKEQIKCYGGLPKIPNGYFLPIAGIDIIDDRSCKMVLDGLKTENKKIDNQYTKDEQEIIFNKSLDTDCFFVQLNAGQIFDFWFGKKTYIDNPHIQAYIDEFLFQFWNYLREEISYEELKDCAKELNDAYEEILKGGEFK